MKATWFTRGILATAMLVGAQGIVSADAVTLLNGRRVEGQIVKDTKDELTINTTYGELHFLKVNLKSISRGGAPAAPAAPAGAPAAAPEAGADPFANPDAPAPAGGDPFGGAPAAAPGADPFGGAPAAAPGGDPFGGGAPAAAPGGDPFGGGAPAAAAPAGGDPFGGGAPAAAAPAGDPFGGAPAAAPAAASNDPFGGGGAPAAPAAAPLTAAPGDPFKVGSASSTALPDNPFHPAGGAAPAAAPAAGGDPFGGGAPAAPAAAPSDPFGAAPPGGASDPFGASSAAPAAAPAGDPFGAPSAPAAAPAAGSDPFSSSSAAPASDPFGAAAPAAAVAASSDPFGSAAAPAAEPAPAAGGDPFSTSSAAAPAAGGDPFGGGAAAAPTSSDDSLLAAPGAAPAVAIEAISQPAAPKEVAAAIPQFKPYERKPAPDVARGFDGVVYGMTKEMPVEVKMAGKEEWAPSTDFTQLTVESHVRTNKTKVSRLKLRSKKDELRLPDESHISLTKLSENGDEVTIFLHAGSIWSEVEHRSKPDSFQVQTPDLTAGVRGTNFRVDRVAGASKVSVFSGSVHVYATKTKVAVTLLANQSAVVNSSGQIMDLIANPVDEQKIWDTWDTWAQQTTAGSGSIAAGFTPIGSLSQQIAQDNARWEADMQEAMRNTAELKYMDKLEQYADAFERFAQDTGKIPETDEGWSLLKFGSDLPGWAGPYVEGPVPPLDPYQHPLIYRKVVSPAGRVLGRVYSMWQDGRDQGGTNASVDKAALVMYYDLARFKNDPTVNPPQK